MYKKAWLFATVLWLMVIPLCGDSQETQIEGKRILVVYDRLSSFGTQKNETLRILQLMKHFKVVLKAVSVNQYNKGDVESCDAVFYIGIEAGPGNPALLQDLKGYEGLLCIIGRGLEQATETTAVKGIEAAGFDNRAVAFEYRGQSYDAQDDNVFTRAEVDFNTTIHSTYFNGSSEYPYILHQNRFWYVASVSGEGIGYYILADLLHEILGEGPTPVRKVYLAAGGINAMTDLKWMRAFGEAMDREGVPFSLEIIPALGDATGAERNQLTANRELTNEIKALQEKGAAIITTELAGLRDLLQNDIYPIAFSARQLGIKNEYSEKERVYFSTILYKSPREVEDANPAPYPYSLYQLPYAETLISLEDFTAAKLNAGYLPLHNLLEMLRVVRDAEVGIFFEAGTDLDEVNALIEMLRRENFEIANIRLRKNQAVIGEVRILTENGELVVYGDVEKDVQDPDYAGYFFVFVRVLGLFVGIICLVFLFIFIISRYRARIKLFRK